MNAYLLKLFAVCLLSNIGLAQVRTVKPVKTHPSTTKLEFGFGGAGSVLYLARNIKDDNMAYGYQVSMVYGGSSLLRFSAEYTNYQPMNIEPTWFNVKAQTAEFNMHIQARFKENRAILYPLFGLSYNVFSGYYTGVNDYLNLTSLYSVNQDVVTRWVGMNAGVGYECYFKHFGIYADYKMRVGVMEGYDELNILDVCLSAGLRYYFTVPSIYKLFRGTRSRYSIKTNPK